MTDENLGASGGCLTKRFVNTKPPGTRKIGLGYAGEPEVVKAGSIKMRPAPEPEAPKPLPTLSPKPDAKKSENGKAQAALLGVVALVAMVVMLLAVFARPALGQNTNSPGTRPVSGVVVNSNPPGVAALPSPVGQIVNPPAASLLGSYGNLNYSVITATNFTGTNAYLNGTWTSNGFYQGFPVFTKTTNGLFNYGGASPNTIFLITNALLHDTETPNVAGLGNVVTGGTNSIYSDVEGNWTDGAGNAMTGHFIASYNNQSGSYSSFFSTNNAPIADTLHSMHLGMNRSFDNRGPNDGNTKGMDMLNLGSNAVGIIKSICFVTAFPISRQNWEMTNIYLKIWSNYGDGSTNLWTNTLKPPQFSVPLGNLISGVLDTNTMFPNYSGDALNTTWIEAAKANYIHAAIRFPAPFTNGVRVALWDQTNKYPCGVFSIVHYDLLPAPLNNVKTFPWCNLMLRSTNFVDQKIIEGATTNFLTCNSGPGALLWLGGRWNSDTNAPQFLESLGYGAWQYIAETKTLFPVTANLASGGEDICLNGYFYGASGNHVQNRTFGTTYTTINSASPPVNFAAEWYRDFGGDGETVQWSTDFVLNHNYASDVSKATNNLSIVYLAP